MAFHTTTSTLRPRPSALTLTLPPPQPQLPLQPTDGPTPPPTPSLTHPASLPSAIHLFYLRVKHLGAGFASEIAASTNARQIQQLHRFFDDGMREYVSELETRFKGSVYEGLGMRILVDAVLRGRTPGVQWVRVCAADIAARRGVVGALEARFCAQREMVWRAHWAWKRRWAVARVEALTEMKRMEGLRKWWALGGLRGEELVWRGHCWEFDKDAGREGWMSLEEEFQAVGEWPDGCGPEDADEEGEYGGDEEKGGGDEDQMEDGWVMVIPKHECECMRHQA